ncbi:MAG: hypothetical protein RR418_05675 [Clostridia bacterium]
MNSQGRAKTVRRVEKEMTIEINNISTNNVEAVYRRKDGTIGLLQPYIEE